MGERLVLIGNGMAATRLVEEITLRDRGLFQITVIGEEPSPAYNRVLLSSLLAREIEEEVLWLKSPSWWTERGISVLSGRPAVQIDPKRKRVQLRGGQELPFDKLVLATGSEAIRLPLPGVDLAGVMTFRTLADAEVLLERARAGLRCVVIGGGLLGLEAAHGLASAGAEVTVVHLVDRLMERQLDGPAAELLASALESRGIKVLLGVETAAIQGRRKATGVRLMDGRVLPADLVVMAVGVRPNVRLARGADLAVNRGIVVCDRLATSAPDVFAIGECAEHRGVTYGLVEPAYEQARTLARVLTGDDGAYSGSLVATNLKVSGLDVFSAGDFLGSGGGEAVVLSDPGRKAYRKLVIRDGRLVGAVFFGDTTDALWYLELIRTQAMVDAWRADLIFGRAFVETQEAA